MPPVQSPGRLADYGAGAPNDAGLQRSVEVILRTEDLNTMTKREIRRVPEKRFSMDLMSRKATISAAIDRLLSHGSTNSEYVRRTIGA